MLKIEKRITALGRLMKTGLGMSEDFLSDFSNELRRDWTEMGDSIEYYKRNTHITIDFLTNLLSCLEVQTTIINTIVCLILSICKHIANIRKE